MYFIETRQLGLEQESAKYGNATKKGQTSNKICSNKLPVGTLNKLLKTQASDISPTFDENSLRFRVSNIRAKFSCHCPGVRFSKDPKTFRARKVFGEFFGRDFRVVKSVSQNTRT